jgi:hypothetical protein
VHLTINALKRTNYDLALVSNTHSPAIPYYANIQSECSIALYLRYAAQHNNCYADLLDDIFFLLHTALSAGTVCRHYSAFVRVTNSAHYSGVLFPYRVLERRPGQERLIDWAGEHDIRLSKSLYSHLYTLHMPYNS